MIERRIQSRANTTASANHAWAVVRDFCDPWHPLVETMKAEAGGSIRRFTVKGDDTVYRERLTWFSDTKRQMGYTHIEGIAGVDRYEARLTVRSAASGATIIMSAILSAAAKRGEEIAAGTQAIFDQGTARVAEMAKVMSLAQEPRPDFPSIESQLLKIDSPPQLVLTVASPASDTLVLFLHGIGGNRSNWETQLAAIAPYAQVAALDLRGYGESSLGTAQSAIDDYCDDILRVMDALGTKRLILCGLSYGAWIATSFAHRYPEKLAGLVVSGGCTGMSEAGPDEREAFRAGREVPLSEGKTPADFAPAVVDVIAGPDASEEVQRELRLSMEAIPTETYADALRCFSNPPEIFDFTRLTMPVLLMTGEHDRLAPPCEIESVAERIWNDSPAPDVRFEVISGAGHVCNLENPGDYNRILSEFATRVLS